MYCTVVRLVGSEVWFGCRYAHVLAMSVVVVRADTLFRVTLKIHVKRDNDRLTDHNSTPSFEYVLAHSSRKVQHTVQCI